MLVNEKRSLDVLVLSAPTRPRGVGAAGCLLISDDAVIPVARTQMVEDIEDIDLGVKCMYVQERWMEDCGCLYAVRLRYL